MNTDFEDRLAHAIDEAIRGQLDGPAHDTGRISTERIAAVLVGTGTVADPAAHQADLQAIAARQDREATAWRDEYCTHGVDHNGNEEPALAWTTDRPEWERGVPVYHRRVTDWKEIHRAQ
ncbi:hypothetical protein [Corynebacterium sp.]|uniref:hypothetical protein n=1 Tax=Corynebacterium sp. TaxID=1720 RepID=UPI0028AB9283|nr:hypothetical protein [Corynebacterium sp.]